MESFFSSDKEAVEKERLKEESKAEIGRS